MYKKFFFVNNTNGEKNMNKQEYKKIVEDYNIGFNCSNDNVDDIAEKIKILYNDENLKKQKGNNNRKLAQEKFERKSTYKEIFKIIEE